ncbi:MAG: DNA recombination protein RmuC, partial [Myxococcaceae bacterium]|nr:DNA recombination protein RmuC [Myxococcaceae bacterium]
MDGSSLVVALLGGGALGAALTAVVFLRRASRAAEALATARAAQQQLEGLRAEVSHLRAALSTAQRSEAGVQAALTAVERRRSELERQVAAERARGDEVSRELSLAQQALREATARGAEREVSMQRLLAERERALAELEATVEQSKAALTDTFKATGGDLLKQSAQALLEQAREHFAHQHRLSQQDLEARQKAIDATLAPLKEQLEKNERLVKELGERREGDAKALGEQLKQLAELQQRASVAAQTLSSALRDNRQRGRWGEVSLRNIAELAGLV